MRQDNAPVNDELQLVGDDNSSGQEADPANPQQIPNPNSALSTNHRQQLAALCQQHVRFDEPMRRHTTLKIGGPADAFVTPPSAEALQAVIAWANQQRLPLTVVGGGSNLLVRDGGIRGVVVGTKALRQIEVDGTIINVAAGVSTGKVLSVAVERGLGGIEFLGGVPGSIGGGLIMNAGTYMGEFKDVTTEVRSVRLSDGSMVVRGNAACGFTYRNSALPNSEIVVGATLSLTPRAKADIEADIRSLRQRRHDREPKKVSSNGSTFKNPTGDFAGRLIETAGCKGWNEGDAECSPVHANWLVNNRAATAAQLLQLIERVHQRVLAFHGIDLQLEVKILGEVESL
jgi:UDP-N-acetylmuramate dehydrogenase